MPYIKSYERAMLNSAPIFAGCPGKPTPGQLNFVLTRIIVEYMKKHGLSYQIINDIIGALEGCRAEFQRRVVQDYEDQKIEEHGDVY